MGKLKARAVAAMQKRQRWFADHLHKTHVHKNRNIYTNIYKIYNV